MCEEKHQRTWETQQVPARAGRRRRPKEAELRTSWESDQRIVLSERESRLQGKGADVDTQSTKETLTEHEGTDDSANLPVGNSEEGQER
jgi:hypothetical protein